MGNRSPSMTKLLIQNYLIGWRLTQLESSSPATQLRSLKSFLNFQGESVCKLSQRWHEGDSTTHKEIQFLGT